MLSDPVCSLQLGGGGGANELNSKAQLSCVLKNGLCRCVFNGLGTTDTCVLII